MKNNYTTFLFLAFLPVAASAITIEVPEVSVLNPSNRHVSASALVLRSAGELNDETIPSNAITQPVVAAPENSIGDVVVEKIDVPQAPVEHRFIVQ